MQLLTCPDVSAGAPNILCLVSALHVLSHASYITYFLPVSVAQHPQKMEAGQHTTYPTSTSVLPVLDLPCSYSHDYADGET